MAPPIKAPILLSGATQMPPVTSGTLSALAPTGSGAAGGAQVIRIGAVPEPAGPAIGGDQGQRPLHARGGDRPLRERRQRRKPSTDVVIASATDPAYAMPAAGWAAESGDPILFVGAPTTSRRRRARRC